MATGYIGIEHDDDGAPYYPVWVGGQFISAATGMAHSGMRDRASARTFEKALRVAERAIGCRQGYLTIRPQYHSREAAEAGEPDSWLLN